MNKRDELAHEYMNSIFRLEPWQEPPDFDECFKHGYDAGFAEAQEQAKVLVEALSFDYEYYAAKQHKWIDLLKELKEALAKFAAYKKD